MTVDMRCQDKERLIAYLYGEDAPDERDAVEGHLASCRACAAEIDGLRAARERLAEWQTPEVDLGFRVVRDAAPVRTGWRVPAWAARPAAAALVLAAGAAIANLEIRYAGDGWTIRSGWTSVPASNPAAEVTAAAPSAPRDEAWREALAETERRLRAEFAAASSGAPAAAATAPVAAATGGASLGPAQIRALIEASERRQQRELALRITEVVQDMESQRRADLVQIDENLGHIEGLTAARQREVMNYLVRVAEGR